MTTLDATEGRQRSWVRWRGRLALAAVVVVLASSGCGARLSRAQIDALNAAGGSNSAGGYGGGGSGTSSALSPIPGSAAGAPGSGGSAPVANNGVAGGGHSTATTASSGRGNLPVGPTGKLCAAGAPSSDPGVTASTITVGNVSTLTGPVPGLFVGAERGTIAFASYINSIGGVCGRRLVVKAADDNLDASQNATATQSMANSVLAFLGSFSVDDQGGAQVLKADGVPDVGEATSADRFNLPNNFSGQPIAPGWNDAPYMTIVQRFGPDVVGHAALFIENNATAQALGFGEKAGLQAIGYKFVYEEDAIEPTQTDFSAEVAQMKSDGVKTVVFIAPGGLIGDMAKDVYQGGLQLYGPTWSASAYDPQFTSNAGPGANGAIIAQSLAMYAGEDSNTVPEVALFNKWYRALYNSTPDLYAAYAWVSGELFVEGLNNGGAPTRAALVQGLRSITSFTANGMSAVDNPAGKVPPNCYVLIDVVNGKFVRDPDIPATGFDCKNTPNYFHTSG